MSVRNSSATIRFLFKVVILVTLLNLCLIAVLRLLIFSTQSVAAASTMGFIAYSARTTCSDDRCSQGIVVVDPMQPDTPSATIADAEIRTSISWSPTYDQLTFSQSGDVYTADLLGGMRENISDSDDLDGGPAWSPSGDQIAYWTNEQNTFNLRLFTFSAAALQTIPLSNYTPPETSPLQWSPAGDQLVFAAPGNRFHYGPDDIFTLDIRTEELTNLTQNSDADYFPNVAQNGEKIAFVSERSGMPEIYIMNMDGSQVERLTSSSFIIGVPQWVMHDNAILYPMRQNRRLILRMVDIHTRQIVTLPAAEAMFEYDVSPDSTHLVILGRQEDTPFVLCIVNLYDFGEQCTPIQASSESGLAWGS